MKRITVFLVILVLLIPLSTASAHRPIWGERHGPIEIPDLRTSFAIYRDLEAGQIDVYTFDAIAGQELHAGIQIPAMDGLEQYGVTAALFGPSFPEADPHSLPSDYPEDLGALVFPSKLSEDFFEPFTQTSYWGRQQIDQALPAGGTYYLLVWNWEDQPGKYVLNTGYEEVFDLADLFRFPVWWLRIHFFFGHGPALGIIGALIVLAGLLVNRKQTKKNGTTKE